MTATFDRATDGQVAIRLAFQDTDDKILLEEFAEEAGTKAWPDEDTVRVQIEAGWE